MMVEGTVGAVTGPEYWPAVSGYGPKSFPPTCNRSELHEICLDGYLHWSRREGRILLSSLAIKALVTHADTMVRERVNFQD